MDKRQLFSQCQIVGDIFLGPMGRPRLLPHNPGNVCRALTAWPAAGLVPLQKILSNNRLLILTRHVNIRHSQELRPVHPGDVLREDFLKPYAISPYRLAKAIGVAPIQISEIIRGKRAISAKTALLLARSFGTSPQFWIRLQAQYDLEVTEPEIHERLAKVPSLVALAA